jgi:hypothetical protein
MYVFETPFRLLRNKARFVDSDVLCFVSIHCQLYIYFHLSLSTACAN